MTDGSNCTATVSATINAAPAALSLSRVITQPSACLLTGSVILTPGGGTTPYTISPSPATTGLVPGTYTFTVTDASNCTATTSATIDALPTALTLTRVLTQPSGCISTGSVVLTPAGGTSPYTISPTPATTGLTAGTYTYTVTDSRNCTATVSATINTAPAALTLTRVITQPTACVPTGSVALTPSGNAEGAVLIVADTVAVQLFASVTV